MSAPTIEALYCEALELADEARLVFDLEPRGDPRGANEDLRRIALSCEALRATTRMMHAIAWLLNQRAFFAGELTELQLRRHGRLPDGPMGDTDNFHLLSEDIRDMVERTIAFHDRVARLDRSWRNGFEEPYTPVEQLRQRLGAAVGSF